VQRSKSNNILIYPKRYWNNNLVLRGIVEGLYTKKIIVFMYLKKYKNTQDKVRICKNDVCIETQGWRSNIIIGSVTFFFICLGIAAITKK
jgi:hypothetical protein